MQSLEPVSADYMVASFLRAEIDSPRNGKFVAEHLTANAATRQLVDSPDLEDPRENRQRAAVLRSRGYPDAFLFAGLPADVIWHIGLASRDEIRCFRYAAYKDWWALSSGTGRVSDGAAGVDRVEMGLNINQQIRDDADVIRGGAERGPLIVVAETPDSVRVLLDGCARATAYALAGDDGPSEVPVIVGLSERILEWQHWPSHDAGTARSKAD
jgi:hypothetical protein